MKIIIMSFLITVSLYSQSEFMKMCLNPTPSQKLTLIEISKNLYSEYSDETCKEIENGYINAEHSYKARTILRISDKNITDLSPLQYLIWINKLDLSGNNIEDITPLAKLINLKQLKISNNPITNIDVLKNLIRLESLSMYRVNPIDATPLKSLKNLKSFSWSDTNTSISVISGLHQLESLYLHRINKDICSLNSLKKLKRLLLAQNNTTNISCLKNLTNLTHLEIQDDPIKNISVVSNYKELEIIDIQNTLVEDISVLKPLKHIVVVNINNTRVTDASPLSGKNMSIFRAEGTPLRWCSPKTGQEIIDGVSCYEKDGTLKPWWKRLFRL